MLHSYGFTICFGNCFLFRCKQITPFSEKCSHCILEPLFMYVYSSCPISLSVIKYKRKDMVLHMNLSYLSNILSIISFVLTLLTFLATLNVRSQIIHYNEKQTFKANLEYIIGKLDGFRKSLLEDKLDSRDFYQRIDIYITDLTSQYTFFNLFIKIRCKYISHILQSPQNNSSYPIRLAKNLIRLKNKLSKEVEL